MDVPIRGFLPTTLIDWPGKLAAEIFVGGCNLRCPYCHAGYLLADSPAAETFEVAHILRCIREQDGWLDGIVVSGGEPTLHEGLGELLRVFKAEGLGVKLDTNGTNPEVVGSLLDAGLVDAVAFSTPVWWTRWPWTSRPPSMSAIAGPPVVRSWRWSWSEAA
jgi:pyruvate formate lyase activating enzyme